ncbi:MAG: sugar-transfer associated ATP-grasp domain-containing protein [Pseudomonadota bacterium]
MSDTAASPSLVSKPVEKLEKPQPMIVRVANEHGVSPFKQLVEAAKMRFGAAKLASNEYYDMGVFRPTLSAAEKQAFVGEVRNKALNLSLSPRSVADKSDLVEDKLAYGALLESNGLSAAQTQAAFSNTRSFEGVEALKSEAEILSFLTQRAVFPLFGKPVDGSKSVGSALFTSIDADAGTLTLGNGREVPLASTVTEITEKFAKGYLFQTAITQHETLSRAAGPALGTMRIVTVAETGVARPIYALWKLPAPKAMSDNFWQAGSMLAELDLATGTVRQVRRGKGLDVEMIETHPETGARLLDLQIPHWGAALSLAAQAHTLAIENGVLGFDIAIAQDGPVVVEGNTNPFHMLFQLATGRGVLNADFAPVFERIAKEKAAQAAASVS